MALKIPSPPFRLLSTVVPLGGIVRSLLVPWFLFDRVHLTIRWFLFKRGKPVYLTSSSFRLPRVSETLVFRPPIVDPPVFGRVDNIWVRNAELRVEVTRSAF